MEAAAEGSASSKEVEGNDDPPSPPTAGVAVGGGKGGAAEMLEDEEGQMGTQPLPVPPLSGPGLEPEGLDSALAEQLQREEEEAAGADGAAWRREEEKRTRRLEAYYDRQRQQAAEEEEEEEADLLQCTCVRAHLWHWGVMSCVRRRPSLMCVYARTIGQATRSPRRWLCSSGCGSS